MRMGEEDNALDHEREYYRNMVAMIIGGDAEKKKLLDERARAQIETVRKQIPHADDESLIIFLVSVAFTMARIMATPFQDVTEIVERMFENNMTAAAAIIGAYDLDSEDLPEVPESEQEMTTEEFETIVNRQYL